MPNDNNKKVKAPIAARLLKKVWILCLILIPVYFVFAGQDHTFLVEIILVFIGVVSWFYGRAIEKRSK